MWYAGCMEYRRCGKSGLLLPAVSLGFWQNFGDAWNRDEMKDLVLGSFDQGVTYFDLANNYGPPPGSAEVHFGDILHRELKDHRDEIVIASKAGYQMWEGPYGNWGSKKYLVSSLDQSLKRMGLDYVDIFYHHRPDPETPLEETMDALAGIVRSGKALYAAISNYDARQSEEAIRMLEGMGVHCLCNQVKLSAFHHHTTVPALARCHHLGVGGVAYSPLCQGVLTGKYLNGIPEDSRLARHLTTSLTGRTLEPLMEATRKLKAIADRRGESLTDLALQWDLAQSGVTTVLVGARNLAQLKQNLQCLDRMPLTEEELKEIQPIIEPIEF